MAEVGSYWFTLKSEETRGASQSNTIHVGLASDADAAIFAANLEILFSADVVSIDKVVANDYATPYPLGTNNTARIVLRGAGYETDTEYLSDLLDATTVPVLATAFKAGAGIGLYNPDNTAALIPIDSATITIFPSSGFR